jgi:hypothetical protein
MRGNMPNDNRPNITRTTRSDIRSITTVAKRKALLLLISCPNKIGRTNSPIRPGKILFTIKPTSIEAEAEAHEASGRLMTVFHRNPAIAKLRSWKRRDKINQKKLAFLKVMAT